MLKSPITYIGEEGGCLEIMFPRSSQYSSLCSSCCCPWCGAYVAINVELCPLVATYTSMMRSECGMTAAMYGLKCGAITTPTLVPVALPELK